MNFTIIKSEIRFKTSRSSGSGGQHVNKVATKVQLIWKIKATKGLSEKELALVEKRLVSKINTSGELMISVQESRSQARNKRLAIQKLEALLTKAIKVVKKRKPTPIPKGIVEKRLKNKQIRKEVKKNRQKIRFE